MHKSASSQTESRRLQAADNGSSAEAAVSEKKRAASDEAVSIAREKVKNAPNPHSSIEAAPLSSPTAQATLRAHSPLATSAPEKAKNARKQGSPGGAASQSAASIPSPQAQAKFHTHSPLATSAPEEAKSARKQGSSCNAASPAGTTPSSPQARATLRAYFLLTAPAPDPAMLAGLARSRGLTLHPGGVLRLLRAEQSALSDTGRLLLDDGVLPPLIEAFADSPYLTGDAAETLAALTELFYHLKNETDDRIPDEHLLKTMRQRFDEPCRGSVEWLADLLGEGRL